MGTATMQGLCGCCKTRLMEPEEDVWITWEVCAKHYRGEEDDRMAAEAAKNRREFEASLKEQVKP